MIIGNYLIQNYILIIMLMGMFIITLFDVYLDRSMIIKLRVVIVLIFALSVFNDLETYVGNLDHFTYWRLLFSVICYSLRPTIIMMMIFIVSPKTNKLIAVPAIINAIIASTAFFSDISFSFETEINHFVRGDRSAIPHIL